MRHAATTAVAVVIYVLPLIPSYAASDGPARTQDGEFTLECGVLAKIAEPIWKSKNSDSLSVRVYGVLTEEGHSDFQAGYAFGLVVEMETQRLIPEAVSGGTTHWELARREFHRKGCEGIQ
jgi:hypothetical protein